MAQTGAVFGSSTEQRHIWQHRGPVPADVGTTKPPRLIAKTVRICVEAVSLPVLLRSLVGWPRLNSFMITDSSVSGSSPQVRGPPITGGGVNPLHPPREDTYTSDTGDRPPWWNERVLNKVLNREIRVARDGTAFLKGGHCSRKNWIGKTEFPDSWDIALIEQAIIKTWQDPTEQLSKG